MTACALARRIDNDLNRGFRTSAKARVFVRSTCPCDECQRARPVTGPELTPDEEWGWGTLLAYRERVRISQRAKLARDKLDPPPARPAIERPRGWCSKTRNAKAHFIDDDGQPACAKLMQFSKARGRMEPKLAPFDCAWGPLEELRDHLCTDCRRMRDTAKKCRCGRCRVEPR